MRSEFSQRRSCEDLASSPMLVVSHTRRTERPVVFERHLRPAEVDFTALPLGAVAVYEPRLLRNTVYVNQTGQTTSYDIDILEWTLAYPDDFVAENTQVERLVGVNEYFELNIDRSLSESAPPRIMRSHMVRDPNSPEVEELNKRRVHELWVPTNIDVAHPGRGHTFTHPARDFPEYLIHKPRAASRGPYAEVQNQVDLLVAQGHSPALLGMREITD